MGWKQKNLLWGTNMRVVEYYETTDGHVFNSAESAEAYEEFESNIRYFRLKLKGVEPIIVGVAPNIREYGMDTIRSLFPACMVNDVEVACIKCKASEMQLMLLAKDSSDNYVSAAKEWRDAYNAGDCYIMKMGSDTYRTRMFSFFCNFIA